MEIYQHFRKEEQPFIDQVLSWKEDVERLYQRKLTDFLDPREQLIFQSIIGNNDDLHWQVFGGNGSTERQRIILAPFYETIQKEDFQITLLEATFPSKFVTLEHRDVLGAFMSLGIKRKKLGDLHVTSNKIHILVDSEIALYIQMNLTGIKKARVQFEEKPLEDFQSSPYQWVEQDGTVASLRLDAIVKEIYQLSRQKSSTLIEKGSVKVNYRMVEDPAFPLEEGDMLSLRGKGRSMLKTIQGQTKKEKWRITTAKLK